MAGPVRDYARIGREMEYPLLVLRHFAGDLGHELGAKIGEHAIDDTGDIVGGVGGPSCAICSGGWPGLLISLTSRFVEPSLGMAYTNVAGGGPTFSR